MVRIDLQIVVRNQQPLISHNFHLLKAITIPLGNVIILFIYKRQQAFPTQQIADPIFLLLNYYHFPSSLRYAHILQKELIFFELVKTRDLIALLTDYQLLLENRRGIR